MLIYIYTEHIINELEVQDSTYSISYMDTAVTLLYGRCCW